MKRNRPRDAILAAMLFAVLSALAGWLLGSADDAAQPTVLGLGTGLRDIPAALIVGVQNFKNPNVSVMLIVTTLTGILILMPTARLIGKRQRGAPQETNPSTAIELMSLSPDKTKIVAAIGPASDAPEMLAKDRRLARKHRGCEPPRE